MPKAEEVATGIARKCLNFVSRVHVDNFIGTCNLLQRLRISKPMYGDQVFIVMHHRFALVTLNLGQLVQEVFLTGKKKL
jgi:hypothetical protein